MVFGKRTCVSVLLLNTLIKKGNVLRPGGNLFCLCVFYKTNKNPGRDHESLNSGCKLWMGGLEHPEIWGEEQS